MIVVKLRDVVDADKGLAGLMAAKLPVKAAYHLKRLASRITPDLKSYNESRGALLEELGTPEKDDKGNPTGMFKFEPEQAKAFQAQIDELLDTEVKIDLDLLSVAAFGDKAEVAAADLLACDKFLKE